MADVLQDDIGLISQQGDVSAPLDPNATIDDLRDDAENLRQDLNRENDVVRQDENILQDEEPIRAEEDLRNPNHIMSGMAFGSNNEIQGDKDEINPNQIISDSSSTRDSE